MSLPKNIAIISAVLMSVVLAACNIRPLNETLTEKNIFGEQETQIQKILGSIHVSPVNDRITQQVRNELIFALQGGNEPETTLYIIDINAETDAQEHSAIAGVRAPTSAQIKITVTYRLREKTTKKIVAQGERAAITGYDLTPQNFANQRAKRDAENRAAKTVARQIYLAIAQQIAGQEKNGASQG